MSTPKPGQIRCPTCLRSTPPAAYCTQCGSPIPTSARARPRGLDREELEGRVRRRPGEGAFRRGVSADEGTPRAYVPFAPEPEDALAARPDEEAAQHVDNLPPPADANRPIPPPVRKEWAPPANEPVDEPVDEPAYPEPTPDNAADEQYLADAHDDEPYGRPEDAYAYPYSAADDRRGGGGGALPIIGFVVLCVLALAVGAVLAGLLGGEEPVGQTSPSPTIEASREPSGAESAEPSVEPSADASATPEPTDGPVTFPDGALLTIQPCGSSGYRQQAVGNPEENACQVDGSSVDNGSVWAMVAFRDTDGSDTLTVQLRSNGETINEQERLLNSVLNDCGTDCDGLIYGAAYQGLQPGEYVLVLRRNGEFADRASFVVEG